MKEIYIKLIGIAVAVMIVLTAFTFTRQNSINEVVEEVKERPFTARILSDVSAGTNPLTVNFEPLVLNEKGKLKYFWDFGDGNTSEEEKPTYLYRYGGDYVCKLTVTDDEGSKVVDTHNITISYNKPPVVVLSLNKNTHERKFIPILSILPLWPGDIQKIVNIIENRNPLAFGEGSIICTAQVGDPEDDEIVSYEWVHQAETQLSKYGKPETPIHNFSGNNSILLPEIYTWPMGRHVLTLTVVDSVGNRANASIEFQVDQSLKNIQRNQKINLFKNLINKWLLVLNPLIGVMVAGILISMWKFNDFEGIKLLTLFILTFLLQIDMGDTLMIQFKVYLQSHPVVLNLVDKLLIKFQSMFPDRDIEAIREQLGLANNRPIIFNPFPEDGSKNIPVETPIVAVNVSDLEGDAFNVTISGDYVNDTTYSGVTNGTFTAELLTPLPEIEEIFWNVEVVDQNGKIVTSEYKFTTFVEV